MLSLIMEPPDSSLLYSGNYDQILVGLSVIVAIFASYAALRVSHFLATSTTGIATRRYWIVGGSLCLGIGIWAMHFIGMLAFTLPCSTNYDAQITFLSTIPGILASALALSIISRKQISARHLVIGGLLIGAGIGTMHYSGMAAMRLNGLIRYDISLFILSIFIAIALAILALWLKFRLQTLPAPWDKWSTIISAIVLGTAVSGMHYTAMAAAYFIREGDSTVSTAGIAPALLSAIVLAATSLIIVITLAATYLNRPNQFSIKISYKLIGILIACWTSAAWLSADYYYNRLTDNLYQQEIQLASQKAELISGNLKDNIELLKAIALIYSRDSNTLQALRLFGANIAPSTEDKKILQQRLSENNILKEFNDNLQIASSSLGADALFVINAAGDCIASSNAGKTDSFIGTNFADRDYFRLAKAGAHGQQYAIGKVSKIPGLFYSHAVFEKDRFIGIVAVKRNIAQFSKWLNQSGAFITDANGVIVLASDKNLEHHYLPEAPLLKLSAEKKLLQYGSKTRLTPLTMLPWEQHRFAAAILMEGRPTVYSVREMSGDAITVYATRTLDEVVHLDAEKTWLFLLLAITGSMLIVAASAIVLYLRESQRTAADLRIAASAFEAQEGMLITDVSGIILRVNKAFTTITGYTATDAIGQNPKLLSSGRHDTNYYRIMWEQINTTGSWEGEIWNRRKNGEIFPEYLTITSVKDDSGTVTHYVGTFNDITTDKLAADEIKLLAFYDHLTGLPNRRLLTDRITHALASSKRDERQGAVLFIDLDNFKALNDTLGHDIGDMLLKQVAQRLLACVREGDTVARLGGDEFVVMLEDLNVCSEEAAAQTESAAGNILKALNQPYQLANHETHSTPSIGATLFGKTRISIDELFKQADIAMYQAKKAGRNTLRFFDPLMQEAIDTRASLEAELRNAIEYQQLQLYYQIQVDNSQHVLGAETLLRWIHPERGMISPAQFIPLAEETGLILPIGLWVLDTACAQLKLWECQSTTRDLVLAVNVSARQFRQADFVSQVVNIIQKHAINPFHLKLELTESLLLENIEAIISTMNELKQIGIQFSLDDFGTGYSSLQYLKKLPLDQLKIDQSFVRDITFDSSDKAIVKTIIAMAHSLNLDVIAEGVETEKQRQMLLDKGCTHFQGYLFGKPVPVAQFEASLKQD